MVDRICSIDGCGRKLLARGVCEKHYARLRRREGPLPAKSAEERFWEKVDKTSSCWNWIGAQTAGYGSFRFDGRAVLAHRFSFELLVEAIGDGMEVDHICRNPRCVRPDHLRSTTRKQNSENRARRSGKSRSGVRGVYQWRNSTRWRAVTTHNHRYIHVGIFDTIEEAEAAVIAKRNQLHTHNDTDHVLP